MKKLVDLFSDISEIDREYTLANKVHARNFNLFTLLRKPSDEVQLHSKFIHELLNIEGTHGQGSLFLNLFLEQLSLKISSKKLIAFREKHNIDILLKSSQESIIIENKIYTQDHSFQLSRYYETMRQQGYASNEITLIYLTLFGHASKEKLEFEVINISYRKEIINWLEACIVAVKEIASLSVALRQYLTLVEELTGKSNKKGFILDVKNLLLQDNNLQMIIKMEDAVIEAKIAIQLDFWQTLLANLIPHYAFSFYNTNNDSGLKSSIQRYYQQQKNVKDYGIEYEVEDNLYFFIELRENIYYGFYFLEEEIIDKKQEEALDALGNQWDEVSSTIYWKYPEKPLNFKAFNHQNIFDLMDVEKREEQIFEISSEIIKFIQNYKRNKIC